MRESNDGEPLPQARRLTIRQRIVNALANGDSKRVIARALRVSINTMTAIAEQEWQRVEAREGLLAARYERIANLATEKQINRLESNEKIPLSVLLSVGGTAVDKAILLRGEPSLTIRHEHTLSTDDKLLDAMREANARAEKRVKAAVLKSRCSRLETHQLPEKTPRKKKADFSDKFGHSNCVILRDSCKLADLHVPC